MSFPKYPEVKDSGVEWLGKVPAHWEVVKLKRLCHMQSGDFISPSAIEEEGKYPVYGGNGHRGFTSSYTHNGLYPIVGRQGALCGNVNYAQGKFWASEHAVVASPDGGVSPVWLGELLRAMDLNQYSITAAQPGLAVEKIKNLFTPKPPLSEQSQIASFLDHETARIDALVEQQQRLIKLLKEKRQAVISHAVTKGLDPNVPMKDSGVEWLGEVPAHWVRKRLKNVSPFIAVGIVVNPSSYLAEEGLPFIYGGEVREGYVEVDKARKISLEDSRRNRKTMLEAGDVVTMRVGYPGVTAVVPPECEGGNCASVMLIKKGCYDSRWLCAAMNSHLIRHQVEIVQYGAAQKQFNIADAVEFWLFEPPVDEQVSIADYIDRESLNFDQLMDEAKRNMELLKERRSALISAAVTGKIDIRGWQADQQAEMLMAAEACATYGSGKEKIDEV
ncbi:restriction endonuclease subunit S [Halomonas sp.]|uniref:restriction endonuclease subunit S n=1 Tax=Halomonas sp. TaxID=1486246 RepID=UPI00384E8317